MSLQYGGDTPLLIASANGHKAIVEVLLKVDDGYHFRVRVSMIQCILIVFECVLFYKCTCVITVW